jgi:predicted TIM-barrel fold metal-dependent hydrolase
VPAPAPDGEPYVDAHAHIWTQDLARYPLAEGWPVAEMNPRSFTAEELLAHCRPAGVGRVNLIQMSFYGFDNSYMFDMIKMYPDRFVGTAIVDPFGRDPARAMRELKPKGARAFRIQSVGPYVRTAEGRRAYEPLTPDRWLRHPGYEAMFAESAAGGQALSCLVGPDAFAEIDRMCAAHPKATVVVDHFGRIGGDGVVRDADVDALCALARHPHVFVKTGALYALGKKTPPYLDLAPLFRRVTAAFGAERCMWESDCPFQVVHHRYIDSLALVRDKLDFLSPDDRERLLRKTAEAVYFAPPAA